MMRATLCAVTIALAAALAAAFAAMLPIAAHAAGTDESPVASRVDPDFAAGKAAIEAKDWKAAIKSFSSAALRDTRNADIENYLGFAYRNSGDLDSAFRHYERALALSPRHRGAHEYLGEAYLMAGNLPKAEEHLAKLKEICLVPCEEYDDLRKKVE